MRFKDKAAIFGLRPEMVAALIIAQRVYDELGKELVVTSARDGMHSPNSLHYSGSAVDLRTRHMTDAEAYDARNELADRLTDEFDVVLETSPRHIHLEIQPSRP